MQIIKIKLERGTLTALETRLIYIEKMKKTLIFFKYKSISIY